MESASLCVPQVLYYDPDTITINNATRRILLPSNAFSSISFPYSRPRPYMTTPRTASAAARAGLGRAAAAVAIRHGHRIQAPGADYLRESAPLATMHPPTTRSQ